MPTQGCKHQDKLMKTKITIFSCSTTKFWGIHKNDVRTGQVNLPLSSSEKQENVLSHPMMKIEYGATCKLDKVIAREEDPLIFTLNSQPSTVPISKFRDFSHFLFLLSSASQPSQVQELFTPHANKMIPIFPHHLTKNTNFKMFQPRK